MKIANPPESWYYDESADREREYEDHPHYIEDKSRAWESKLECMFDDWLQRPGGEYDALGECSEDEYEKMEAELRRKFETENDDEIQLEYFEWSTARWELDNSIDM